MGSYAGDEDKLSDRFKMMKKKSQELSSYEYELDSVRSCLLMIRNERLRHRHVSPVSTPADDPPWHWACLSCGEMIDPHVLLLGTLCLFVLFPAFYLHHNCLHVCWA